VIRQSMNYFSAADFDIDVDPMDDIDMLTVDFLNAVDSVASRVAFHRVQFKLRVRFRHTEEEFIR